MEVVTSCIIYERIVWKFGKCSYKKSKEAGRLGMYLCVYVYI